MASKKETTDMSVEVKLKSLYQLQTLLSKIDEIRTLRGELPLEVQDLEDEIAGLTLRVNKFQEEIESLQTDISMRRGKISESQKLIERYKEQLNDVKNNREYDMLVKEIEFQELDIELQNKRIREAEKNISDRNEAVEAATNTLKEREEDLNVKRAELEEIVNETRAEEDKLREKANALEMTIEPRLLTAFKRIRKNSRNGLGVVYVQRDACGGCFNKIPPQRQLDIRMRKKIIVCEYCGRIMIDPELAGVKIAAKVEEKPKRKRAIRKKEEEA